MRITDLLAGISVVLWLAVIGVVVYILLQSARGKPVKNSRRTITTIVIISLVFSVLSAGLVFIEPQERGMVISALNPDGYRSQVLQPGLRWIIPFFERVEIYPISRQTYTMSIVQNEGDVIGDDSISARTSDGQEIFVDASVIFEIDPQKVVQVHILWQDRYATDLVRAQSRGVIRDGVSKFGVEEIISEKRFELVDYIETQLSEKLAENGLHMVDFVLRNITFSPEYAASVEQKQIAEQQVEQQKFVVEQKKQEALQAVELARGEAEARIIEAEGAAEARLIEAQAEADALKLLSDILQNNPDLLTYQYINKLAPTITTMLLPNENPFIFQLPETP
ncbi:MAG TPA: hypothetical protein DCK95_01185 [Anaerolineaceae bacterium]|nr:hypothetical protein [Anaerolineaceae bacterium]